MCMLPVHSYKNTRVVQLQLVSECYQHTVISTAQLVQLQLESACYQHTVTRTAQLVQVLRCAATCLSNRFFDWLLPGDELPLVACGVLHKCNHCLASLHWASISAHLATCVDNFTFMRRKCSFSDATRNCEWQLLKQLHVVQQLRIHANK